MTALGVRMSTTQRLALAAVIGLTLLHQDVWLWHDPTLVGGIVPIGLAYHGVFSLVAAAVWGGIVMFAWPGSPLPDEVEA
jgi:alpha-D-ribose 1-methylphosphonate 5-triphosphate synthase subunit PhnH